MATVTDTALRRHELRTVRELGPSRIAPVRTMPAALVRDGSRAGVLLESRALQHTLPLDAEPVGPPMEQGIESHRQAAVNNVPELAPLFHLIVKLSPSASVTDDP